jgi:hypothetical protein
MKLDFTAISSRSKVLIRHDAHVQKLSGARLLVKGSAAVNRSASVCVCAFIACLPTVWLLRYVYLAIAKLSINILANAKY